MTIRSAGGRRMVRGEAGELWTGMPIVGGGMNEGEWFGGRRN